ncbi:MAG: efflux RND transporter periplasmic adaptor subunit [Pseudoxanthomonas suwonensis]|nr:efflux RND transporter periplasmic adaptor subunit [Pseudoxanthomonas suwonensis]
MTTARKPRPAYAGKRKFPLVPVLVAAVLMLGAGAWWMSKRGAADPEEQWRTTAVSRGDIRVTISATGTLSALSTVDVGSQISGQVTDVLVDFNDRVSRGQVIARIDPSTYEAQIAQGNASINAARASLASAEASLRNAEADYQRKASLVQQQLIARGDVDLARAARDQARAQVNSARAQIAQQTANTQTTRLNLQRTVIRSPVDGVVLTRTIEPGQTVAASLQAPVLFQIAEDLVQMQIVLAIDESDIGQVEVGQAVGFTVDAFPDRRFRGKVEQVRLSATTTSNVVTYPVVVAVDNADQTLLPGMTANAQIEVSSRENVLLVSNAALRYRPAEGSAAAAVTPEQSNGGGAGGGVSEELPRLAASLEPTAEQQAAFDAALAQMRERAAARQAPQTQQNGGSSLFGGGGQRGMGMGGPRGGRGPASGQMRARMIERFNQQFGAFRELLSEEQQRQWDVGLAGFATARRAPLYLLENGQPAAVTVRVGVTDGSNTEISGNGVEEGAVAITGERARQAGR